MPPFARKFGVLLLFAGGLLFILGLVFFFGGKIPFFGDVPGDFHFEGERFEIFFPLGSAVLISLGLTVLINLLLWLINR
ncbi:MAG: DUF2905 domain-containing protein [Candidatus Acetothermia bacterium]